MKRCITHFYHYCLNQLQSSVHFMLRDDGKVKSNDKARSWQRVFCNKFQILRDVTYSCSLSINIGPGWQGGGVKMIHTLMTFMHCCLMAGSRNIIVFFSCRHFSYGHYGWTFVPQNIRWGCEKSSVGVTTDTWGSYDTQFDHDIF